MASIEESIETLSQGMIQDANAAAARIVAAAREQAEEIRRRAEEQAQAERQVILERADREVERLRSQAIATTQLKARNQQLEHREKLLNSVFAAARERLSSVQQWNSYENIACTLLSEAAAHLPENTVQIKADPLTMRILSEMLEGGTVQELNLDVRGCTLLDKGTGLIVETADGHLNYDNTLETRLARLQSMLRAPVYHILMGEYV